jgi:hypothetical protein
MIRLLIILSLLLSGCNTTGVNIPRPPKWVDTGLPPVSSNTVVTWVAVTQPYATADLSDSTFTVVDHDWLLAMVKWSDAFLRQTNHHYTAESFDCDKFAAAFALGVNWVAGDAGVKAQPLVARVYVVQAHTFANIPGSANGAHALIGFRSNRGFFILEPQGDGPVFLRLAPLSDYPNKITRIKLGG